MSTSESSDDKVPAKRRKVEDPIHAQDSKSRHSRGLSRACVHSRGRGRSCARVRSCSHGRDVVQGEQGGHSSESRPIHGRGRRRGRSHGHGHGHENQQGGSDSPKSTGCI